MNKIRLLVVDDEPYIVEALAQLMKDHFGSGISLRWSDSALTAREMILQEPCDVLLSDIQMPGLSGFELARICRERMADAKIIFLTGYDRFAYAREAIRVDAFDYILKTEEDERMLEVVARALEELQKERTQKPPERNALLRRYLLLEILGGKRVCLTDREQQELQISDPLVLAVASGARLHARSENPQQAAAAFAEAFTMLESVAPLCSWVECVDLSIDLALVARIEPGQEERFAHQAPKGFGPLDVSPEWRHTAWQRTDIQSLADDYRAASETVYMLPSEESGDTEGAVLNRVFSQPQRSQELWREVEVYQLRRLIEQCETGILTRMPSVARDSANRLCDQLFSAHSVNRNYASEICGRFATMLQHQLNTNGLNLCQEQDVFSDVMNGLSGSPEAARKRVHAVIQQLMTSPAVQPGTQEPVVQQMKRLIKAYLSENITLTHLAALTNYSEAHLNRIFRKAEGVSVHAYINQKRLDAARKLLLTTDLRIGDIAALCGFDTASYFVRFFKKATDTTPQQFRIDHRQKQQLHE